MNFWVPAVWLTGWVGPDRRVQGYVTLTTDQQFEKIIISGRSGSRETIKPTRGDQGVPTTHLWEEVPATVELPN